MLVIGSIFLLYVVILDISNMYSNSLMEELARKKYEHTIIKSICNYKNFSSAFIAGTLVLMISFFPVITFFIN